MDTLEYKQNDANVLVKKVDMCNTFEQTLRDLDATQKISSVFQGYSIKIMGTHSCRLFYNCEDIPWSQTGLSDATFRSN